MKDVFGQGISDYGKTEAVGSFEFGASTQPGTIGSTEPIGVSDWGSPAANPGVGPTMDAPNASFTTPTDNFTKPSDSFFPEDPGVTEAATPGNIHGFMPVVGWLVCIDGVDRGRDYRIHNGMNNIGRDPSNDVCISGDMRISREIHARIAFDSQECLFFAAPGNGMNLVRLNNKVLMMASELHAGDILTIGSSKLMFVPFCTESFSWESHE